jgi:cyclase
MSRRRIALAASVLVVLGLVSLTQPQPQDFSKVEIKTEKLADGLHVLFGAGGNIGVSSGPDGVLVIDDDYAPLTDKILAAIKAISPQPVRFVLNTHWHGDHTGGNENLGKAGSVIVAHDNVRRRLSTEQFVAAFNLKVPASPQAALPVITYPQELTFHLNGDELHAVHVTPAHTDGDSFVHFRKARALHMGDTFFNGMYPFIDLSSGGSVDGMIAAADIGLKMADDCTRIIPGHGPVGDVAALRAFGNVLVTVRDRVQKLKSAGRTLEEVIATNPTADLDPMWGKG